jgi:hypothetical protein
MNSRQHAKHEQVEMMSLTLSFKQVQAASSSGPLAASEGSDDVARRTWKLRRHIDELQLCISSLERCEKRKFPFLHSLYRRISGWWRKAQSKRQKRPWCSLDPTGVGK